MPAEGVTLSITDPSSITWRTLADSEWITCPWCHGSGLEAWNGRAAGACTRCKAHGLIFVEYGPPETFPTITEWMRYECL